MTRPALTYVETDIAYCSLTYGVAPCTAAIPTTGTQKCFNCYGSCQDLDHFAPEDKTLRFAIDTGHNPVTIEAIPSVLSVDVTPAVISLGEDLGSRSSVQVSFADHPHSDAGPGFDKYLSTRSVDPWTRGSFWAKFRARHPNLRGRALRVIHGFVGDALADMETRHFIVESFDGPGEDGVFTIIAKDPLKLLDDDRAQAPLLSGGFLAGDITSSSGSCTLSPTGIGNSDYPSSGRVAIGGNEICTFTRSGDTVTFTARGTDGTTASAHSAGDRVQLCLRYSAQSADAIISDLMTTYGGVDSGLIPADAWDSEVSTFSRQLYTAVIAEPTAVRQLVSELVQQAALAIWWSDTDQQVYLQVLRNIPSDAAVYDSSIIRKGTLRIEEQPDKRTSQVWTYFAQRSPLGGRDDPNNYRSCEIEIDADAEARYGSAAIKKIFSRWIPFGGRSVAARLNALQLGRYVTPPRKVSFELMRSPTEQIAAAGGYQLLARSVQDVDGSPLALPFEVTSLAGRVATFLATGEEITWTTFDSGDFSHLTIAIDSDANAINLRSIYDAIYPTPVSGNIVTFTIGKNVVIGSTGVSKPAVTVGNWPAGVTVNVNVYGKLYGAGGKGGKGGDGTGDDPGHDGLDGGTAFYTRFAVNLHVFSGGGIWSGGGGGGGFGPRIYDDHKGGGGGGGAGIPGGAGGNGPGNAESGSAGTRTTGGQGGRSWTNDALFQGPILSNYRGGTGGDPGHSGSSGGTNEPNGTMPGGDGGDAGNAIDGDSYVTLTNAGTLSGHRRN